MYSVLIIIASFLISPQDTIAQTGKVILLTADCAIHPPCAEYIISGIKTAEQEGAACVIIKLNTPGGLLKSTRVIVTSILESQVPVAVFVAPSGSQAASAGVFITLAAHVAAMAPGTNIGAAHPVSLQGQQDSVMMEKATNDAAAFIRTISEKRNRNVSWAEDAVRKSLSITETEAFDEDVIDYVSKDVNELLDMMDGREVETINGRVILNTKNARVEEIDMSLTQRLLSILSDPNFAYILLMLGIYGLFFELYNPGAIFPGVVGGICLILAFYSMHTLPVNYAGLALIIFAVILFILEIKVISHGILTIGGIISLFLGSMMLIKEESALQAMKISIELIILIVVLSAAFFLFAISFGVKAQRKKVTTGMEGFIGKKALVITNLKPLGEVTVHGEIWRAESVDGNIQKGRSVQVVGTDNFKLIVKKIDPPS